MEPVKVEEQADGQRWFYEYEEPTRNGERLEVDFTLCSASEGSISLPKMWHKKGYTETVLESWWYVQVYATDQNGICRGKYNPTAKLAESGTRYVHDFDWTLEATDENREKILREIERRAFGND